MTVMLERLSRIFATNAAQQKALQHELHEYLMQHRPLSELVSKKAMLSEHSFYV